MVTKRSKVYTPCLYMQIKCKSMTVYIKNKKGGGGHIIVLKGTCHFKFALSLIVTIIAQKEHGCS